MARIRTIKPEFPQSESMGRVSRESRLCFILLFTLADDAGRLRGNSRMLSSLLYPYDDDAKKHIESWLSELHKEQCITRYEIEGDQYIQLNKWLQHQKIDKPSQSKIPPPDNSVEFAKPREDSYADQGKDQGKERIKDSAVAPPDGVSQSTWQDFLKIRKAKKAPMTDAALQGIDREAKKAGWSLESALQECCLRGWQGFKAEWVAEKTPVQQITTPARAGPDPALAKIIAEQNLVKPMPPEIRAALGRK